MAWVRCTGGKGLPARLIGLGELTGEYNGSGSGIRQRITREVGPIVGTDVLTIVYNATTYVGNAYIEVSIDNGTTWATINDRRLGTHTDPYTDTISLASYTGMDIMIRFRVTWDLMQANRILTVLSAVIQKVQI